MPVEARRSFGQERTSEREREMFTKMVEHLMLTMSAGPAALGSTTEMEDQLLDCVTCLLQLVLNACIW
jgi:hypothetical protein